MIPFHVMFPEVAPTESRSVTPVGHAVLPSRPLLLVENYCVDRGCDCRRVLLAVHDAERRRQLGTVNYAFEPPTGHDADLGQFFLDRCCR